MSVRNHSFALVGEHCPAYHFRGGTSNIIKTLTSYPGHPFCAVVATDHEGPKPIRGPWDNIPTLPLFRPKSLFPNLRLGLGLLDNAAFRLQRYRVARFLDRHRVERLFVLIANNPRFPIFAAQLPVSIPMDIYIVDDFVADSHIYKVRKETAQQVLDRLVMRSDRVFAISPVYAADLQERYGKPCHFLPIPIADELLDDARAESTDRSSSEFPAKTGDYAIVIHHSGHVHHLYADALSDLAAVLQTAAQKKNKKISLEFWGNVTPGSLEKALKINLHEVNRTGALEIKLCGTVPPAELARQQQRADFLLLANSFLPELEKQVRCSFSSKVCEYMIAGVPILLYAPRYSSLAVHLGEHRAAYMITDNNKKNDPGELEYILSAPNKDRVVEAARSLAFDVHSCKAFFDSILTAVHV
jgi:glycosyltransferase involved in cell wall biosynthesis